MSDVSAPQPAAPNARLLAVTITDRWTGMPGVVCVECVNERGETIRLHVPAAALLPASLPANGEPPC